MLRKNFPGRKAKRRAEGEVRDAAFRALSKEEKLARNSKRYAERVAGK